MNSDFPSEGTVQGFPNEPARSKYGKVEGMKSRLIGLLGRDYRPRSSIFWQ